MSRFQPYNEHISSACLASHQRLPIISESVCSVLCTSSFKTKGTRCSPVIVQEHACFPTRGALRPAPPPHVTSAGVCQRKSSRTSALHFEATPPSRTAKSCPDTRLRSAAFRHDVSPSNHWPRTRTANSATNHLPQRTTSYLPLVWILSSPQAHTHDASVQSCTAATRRGAEEVRWQEWHAALRLESWRTLWREREHCRRGTCASARDVQRALGECESMAGDGRAARGNS